MIDLLYILGNGSRWDDNELRYSLRSVERHLPHHRVIIVGHRPGWVRHVEHIAAGDPYEFPVRNTLLKLQVAAESGALGDRFVLMNDDFLLLRDWDPDAPAIVAGPLQHRITEGPCGADPHYRVLADGLRRMRAAGLPEPLNYDVHAPLTMRTELVLEMLRRWGGAGSLYPWRSVYGNLFRVPAQLGKDRKQRALFTLPAPDHEVMSPSDEVALIVDFQVWCAARWRQPSRYER